MDMSRQDRPLRRRLVKLGFSMLAGRRRAHWQDTYPDLTIDRANGWILHGGTRAGTLSPAALRPEGGEITIVGSGPSLRDQDLGRLPPRSAVLLNGAILLAARTPPLAIFVEDERFVWRHGDILRGAPRDCPLFLSPAVIRALIEQDPAFLTGRTVMLIDNLLKPVHGPRRSADDPQLAGLLDPQKVFSLDPATGVMRSGTVAYSAMQFAVAAGPQRIGLAGIDLINGNQPRFYEGVLDRAPSGLVRGLDQILTGFSAARSIAEGRGITLHCHSPVSALLDIGYPLDLRLGAVPGRNLGADAGQEVAVQP